jgi:pimeloyl-ACP methyl ester carboxylesterase
MNDGQSNGADGRAVVTIDGIDLEAAFHVAEDPGAPVIVFLHEGLGSLSIWRDFPSRLASAAGCGALVYSRYGYGRSTVCETGFEPDYMHREALETLPALLDHFEILNPILYGHSDGASIALIHAGDSGRPVRGLIVEAPHVFVEAESLVGLDMARDAYENQGLKESLARHHTDAARTFSDWHTVWGSQGFRDWNLEGYLPSIESPVLMVQGAEDAYGSLDQLDAIERGVSGPCEREILSPCGHSPHREVADRVLDRAVGFISGLVSLSR